MSGKSRNSRARRPAGKEPSRKAKQLADRYRIVLEFADGEWYGHGLELPKVFGDGKTPGRCVTNTRAAMAAAVAAMIEHAQKPPAPAGAARTQQVNIRLTAEEKTAMETSAKVKGFRGLSDFVRAGALAFAK